jgi:hypothetical protein
MAIYADIDLGLLKSGIRKTYASVSEEPGHGRLHLSYRSPVG